MKHDINFYKHPQDNFTQEMVNDTLKYQKQYGFKIGENNLAVDNEADAFRHAYMQAYLSLFYRGNWVAKQLGNFHERSGKLPNGKYKKDSNMDLWNNEQGRQIATKIKREHPDFKKYPLEKQKDIIAQEVDLKMKSGDLITGLDDTREYNNRSKFSNIFHHIKTNSTTLEGSVNMDVYKNNTTLPFTPTRGVGGVKNNGQPMGSAAPVQEHIFTPEEIDKMTQAEFKQNENQIMQQMANGQIQNQAVKNDYYNFKNSYSGSDRIFTREDIAKMSSQEYSQHEKEIDA